MGILKYLHPASHNLIYSDDSIQNLSYYGCKSNKLLKIISIFIRKLINLAFHYTIAKTPIICWGIIMKLTKQI